MMGMAGESQIISTFGHLVSTGGTRHASGSIAQSSSEPCMYSKMVPEGNSGWLELLDDILAAKLEGQSLGQTKYLRFNGDINRLRAECIDIVSKW